MLMSSHILLINSFLFLLSAGSLHHQHTESTPSHALPVEQSAVFLRDKKHI